MHRLFFFLSCFLLLNVTIFSQKYNILTPSGGGEPYLDNFTNCISDSERVAIKKMLNENVELLVRDGVLQPSSQRSIVSFDWPLQKVSSLEFNSYYATNNFVDQDQTSGLQDYHCDARTYNGHLGSDFDTWPFPWYLYDNDLVEVIAGEAGTIIGKTDGNEDDHCSCTGTWNAIFIQHADGSKAWYGHMKANSLTSKNIGASVAKGEYLGVVASSGCSTQPHLHFEVLDEMDNTIDPYSGSCNSLNPSSWWATQPPNREPTLNALLTHYAVPEHGCPGINEDPHFSNSFNPGDVIYMAAYYHDQLVNDVSNLRVRRPNNTIWQSWSHTSP